MLQTHDLLDRLDLGIVHEVLARRLAHVEELSPQWEHAVVVPTNDRESRDGESLGGVSLGEDERALGSRARAGVVGVLELDESGDTSEVSAVLA